MEDTNAAVTVCITIIFSLRHTVCVHYAHVQHMKHYETLEACLQFMIDVHMATYVI